MNRLATRLKKEKIHVDVVCFGEEDENIDKLTQFVETINGKEQKDGHIKYDGESTYLILSLFPPPSSRCHLVHARPGPMLSDAIINSPIMAGEDGNPIGAGHGGGSGGFDFGMDPADDPELAMVGRE